jgi:hypothetical protein
MYTVLLLLAAAAAAIEVPAALHVFNGLNGPGGATVFDTGVTTVTLLRDRLTVVAARLHPPHGSAGIFPFGLRGNRRCVVVTRDCRCYRWVYDGTAPAPARTIEESGRQPAVTLVFRPEQHGNHTVTFSLVEDATLRGRYVPPAVDRCLALGHRAYARRLLPGLRKGYCARELDTPTAVDLLQRVTGGTDARITHRLRLAEHTDPVTPISAPADTGGQLWFAVVGLVAYLGSALAGGYVAFTRLR